MLKLGENKINKTRNEIMKGETKMATKVTPLGDRVLVKRLEPQQKTKEALAPKTNPLKKLC